MKQLILTGMALIILLCASQSTAATKIKSLCDIGYPSDVGIEWECQKLTSKDTPLSLFGERWQDVLRFNRIDRRHFVGGLSIKVPKDLQAIKNFSPLPVTYPAAEQEEKFILVDLSEMFLGAYENGKKVTSFPVAVGMGDHPVPTGEFRIDAVDLRHKSNLYNIEEVGLPYPMHYGLRFFVDKSRDDWPSFWIHGRDLPGYPASHGCIGLYDEEMQKEYYSDYDKKVNKKHYRELKEPYLKGAKDLYQWVVGSHSDSGEFHKIGYGPKVLIIGSAPSDAVTAAW
ncbi:MAG TPA: L,D-transpeptidase [Desulfuromonadaceae bacterium]|jgi:hypothetical protein